MVEIDDYNLIDEDFEEFMRRGRECFAWEEEKGNERLGKQERHGTDRHRDEL